MEDDDLFEEDDLCDAARRLSIIHDTPSSSSSSSSPSTNGTPWETSGPNVIRSLLESTLRGLLRAPPSNDESLKASDPTSLRSLYVYATKTHDEAIVVALCVARAQLLHPEAAIPDVGSFGKAKYADVDKHRSLGCGVELLDRTDMLGKFLNVAFSPSEVASLCYETFVDLMEGWEFENGRFEKKTSFSKDADLIRAAARLRVFGVESAGFDCGIERSKNTKMTDCKAWIVVPADLARVFSEELGWIVSEGKNSGDYRSCGKRARKSS